MSEPLDLAKPIHLRAEMARAGLAPTQMTPYEDAERGWVDPLDDDEIRTIVRGFMSALWSACLQDDVASRPPCSTCGGSGKRYPHLATFDDPCPDCREVSP